MDPETICPPYWPVILWWLIHHHGDPPPPADFPDFERLDAALAALSIKALSSRLRDAKGQTAIANALGPILARSLGAAPGESLF